MSLLPPLFASFGVLWKLVVFLALTAISKFLIRLYQVRRRVRDVSDKYGIPILPHSFLFGHLIHVGKLMDKQPPYVAGQILPLLFLRENPELFGSGIAYIDIWPFVDPMLAVYHPDIMAQFTQENSLPKHAHLRWEFEPFTQGNDLVSQEGQVWKTWRSIFNPGFSAKNLQYFVPQMIEEILVFRNWLKQLAVSGDVAILENQTSKLTTDVISRATLGARLDTQMNGSVLYDALKSQVSWIMYDMSPRNVGKYLNPMRQYYVWKNNRTMRNLILPHIRRTISQHGKQDGLKTINSLAVKAYLNEVKPSSTSTEIDSSFIDIAIAQLKTFLFAGSDTTASAICYAYHLLQKNPHTIAAIIKEHDSVLGTDPSEAAQLISDSPHLLNQLPYTSAVIKEVLRLYPPIGSVREGNPSFFLTHPDNNLKYPTDGFLVFSCSIAEHRNPEFWPRPDEFVPERWLTKEGDPMHPRKNAYRPFELGPRNCIGQELAQLELRAILALTVREYDIEAVFDNPELKVLDEVAYQCTPPTEVTAHPRDGMPVRVKVRGSK